MFLVTLVRMVQNLRREKGLDVSDLIDISINAENIITEAVKENYSFICSQVLANNISLDNKIKEVSEKIAGYKININF